MDPSTRTEMPVDSQDSGGSSDIIAENPRECEKSADTETLSTIMIQPAPEVLECATGSAVFQGCETDVDMEYAVNADKLPEGFQTRTFMQQVNQVLEVLKTTKSPNGHNCSCDLSIDVTSAKTDNVALLVGSICRALCQRDGEIKRCSRPLSLEEYRFRFTPCVGAMTPLCSTHQLQLRLHLACPICGIFIESGSAAVCSTQNAAVGQQETIHLFHRACLQSGDKTAHCPHCGTDIDGDMAVIVHPFGQTPVHVAAEDPVGDILSFFPPEDDVVAHTGRYFSPLSNFMPFSCKGLWRNEDVKRMTELIHAIQTRFQDSEVQNFDESLIGLVETDNLAGVAMYLLKHAPFREDHPKAEEMKTAVFTAVTWDRLLCVHLLHYAHVPVDMLSSEGESPIMLAVLRCHFVLVRYLKEQLKCNLDRPDAHGKPVICRLLESPDSSHIIYRLLEEYLLSPSMLDLLISDEPATIVPPDVRAYAERFAPQEKVWKQFVKAMETDDQAAACLLIISSLPEIMKYPIEDVEQLCSKNLPLWGLLEGMWAEQLENYVTCPDITCGKELLPIPVMGRSGDANPMDHFTYVKRNVFSGAMSEHDDSKTLVALSVASFIRCSCGPICFPDSCGCRLASTRHYKDGRLLPETSSTVVENANTIFECNELCGCGPSCGNRVVQKGIACPFQVRRSPNRGWGLFATSFLVKGTFLAEYCGEIIGDKEANYRTHNGLYLFEIRPFRDAATPADRKLGAVYCVDAAHKGNAARFLNHSCDPNAAPIWVFSDIQDQRFPGIAFFTTKDIHPGEEICFDYGKGFWRLKSQDFNCECGAFFCYYRKPVTHNLTSQGQLAASAKTVLGSRVSRRP